MRGKVPAKKYLEMLKFQVKSLLVNLKLNGKPQEALYPEKAVKMRFVENHDVMPVMRVVSK